MKSAINTPGVRRSPHATHMSGLASGKNHAVVGAQPKWDALVERCRKLTKERDELADANAKLQSEVQFLQDHGRFWAGKWAKMKSEEQKMMRPKRRSERIKESLKSKKQK